MKEETRGSISDEGAEPGPTQVDVATMEAGPELDRLILRRVVQAEFTDDPVRIGEAAFGEKPPIAYELRDGSGPGLTVNERAIGRFAASADLAAAFGALEVMRDRIGDGGDLFGDWRRTFPVIVCRGKYDTEAAGWAVTFWGPTQDDPEWWEECRYPMTAAAPTLPLAICRAALLALETPASDPNADDAAQTPGPLQHSHEPDPLPS